MNLNNMKVGGWKIADMTPVNLPQKAASAFIGATEKLVGANYEPVLYAGAQAVNGVNYGIICKETIPAPGGAYESLVFMVVHEAFDGEDKYSIASINPII